MRRALALQTNCPHVRQSKWHKQGVAWRGAGWGWTESTERTNCKWQSMICERVDAAGAADGVGVGRGSGSASLFGVNVCVPGAPSIRAMSWVMPLCCSCPMSVSGPAWPKCKLQVQVRPSRCPLTYRVFLQSLSKRRPELTNGQRGHDSN